MTPRGHMLLVVTLGATTLVAVHATRVYAWSAALITALALFVFLLGAEPSELAGWAIFACAVFGLLWPGIAVCALIMLFEMSLTHRKGNR